MRISTVVVAAGEGRRFGADKPFAELRGKTILDWSLASFQDHELVSEIVLVLKEKAAGLDFSRRYSKISHVVRGGPRRQDSVEAGFRRLDPEREPIVLIHDGVRPLVDTDLIARIAVAAADRGAAVPGLAVEDTIKRIIKGKVKETVPRADLMKIQTPQGFRYPVLAAALKWGRERHETATDEAVLAEQAGFPVYMVPGEKANIKITEPEDLRFAEVWLEYSDRSRL